MTIIFWLSLTVILYAYIGYPVLLMTLARFIRHDVRRAAIEPTVTVIISAYNEEKHIAKKIETTISLLYPRAKIQIIVVSDGSTDRTDEIVKSYYDYGVQLLRVEGRKGKTAAQNAGVAQATGEIIIFTDATTYCKPNVIHKIVRNFADPQVGCVGGGLTYLNAQGKPDQENNGAYWRYEKKLKALESHVGSLIGVSGCLYAVRRPLYEPIDPAQISDFVIAHLIVRKGYRVVYEPEACSLEYVTDKAHDEFAMRVRVALRSIHGIWYMRDMLNPLYYGFYALQLFSHKVLRYALPWFMLLFLASSLFACREHIIYAAACGLHLAFYAAVLLGALGRAKVAKGALKVPFYFFLINWAALVAFMQFLQGKQQVTWNTVR